MKGKKLTSVLLAIALLLSLLTPSAVFAGAAGTAVITAGEVEVDTDASTVTVPVSIENNPGFMFGCWDISYDTVRFTLSGITAGEVLTTATVGNNISGNVAQYFDMSSNINGDGKLFDLVFTINDASAVNASPVSLAVRSGDPGNLVNSTPEVVPATYTAGSITITAATDPNAPVQDANGYYLIGNAEQFMWFADQVNNQANLTIKVKLTANIDLTGEGNWAEHSIGTCTNNTSKSETQYGGSGVPAYINPFKGIFDGDDHTVTYAMSYSGSYSSNRGLFGIAIDAVIKNVTVEGGVNNPNSYGITGGSVVGWAANTTIENVVNNAAFQGGGSNTTSYFGGIIGKGYSVRLTDVENNASVHGGNPTGGIAGALKGNSVVSNAANNGEIFGGTNTGGIAGTAEGSTTIGTSVNTGVINAGSGSGGGIVGATYTSTVVITNVENSGDVLTTATENYGNNIGGIVGMMNGGTIVNAVNSGNITATNNDTSANSGGAGGIAGIIYDGSVTNGDNSGTVTGTLNNLGGIVGNYSAGGTGIADCDNTGNVIGTSTKRAHVIGGVIGYAADLDRVSNNTFLTGTAALGIGNIAYTDDNVLEVNGSTPSDPAVWDGVTIDVSWYNDIDTEFTLTTAAQFAGFAAIVNNKQAVSAAGAVTGTNPAIPADDFAGKTVKLGIDVDLGGVEESAGSIEGTTYTAPVWRGVQWTPIGSYTSSTTENSNGVSGRPFKGTFDGQFHKISGMYVYYAGSSYDSDDANGKSLFGDLGRDGLVKNVIVASGYVRGARFTGGVVGRNWGHIESCVNYATVETTGSRSGGGIAGVNYNNGAAWTPYIKDSANFGLIATGDQANPGGIVGDNEGTVYNSYNAAKGVHKSNPNSYAAGGIVGGGRATGTVVNSWSLNEAGYPTRIFGKNTTIPSGSGFKTLEEIQSEEFVAQLGFKWVLDSVTGYPMPCAPAGDNTELLALIAAAQALDAANYTAASWTAAAIANAITAAQAVANKNDATQGEINAAINALSAAIDTLVAAKWDGNIDVSWYNDTDTEFHISTPQEFAGLAAIVNGTYNIYSTGTNVTQVTGDDNHDKIVYLRNNTVSPPYIYGADDFHGKTVYIDADLDMGGVYDEQAGTWSGPNYMPIGGQYQMNTADTGTLIGSSFCGTLDAQGHTIANIYCERWVSTFANGQSIGLIGRLGVHDSEATLYERTYNPSVRNVIITGYISGNRSVGGIVGKMGKTAYNYSPRPDGAVGGIIENCVNYAHVNATDAKGGGGIVGAGWNGGYVKNCINYGRVEHKYSNASGGIVGSAEIKIINSINFGLVTQSSGTSAAIASNNGGASAENCYWLTGSADAGGYNMAAGLTVKTADELADQAILAILNSNNGDFKFGNDGKLTLYFVDAVEKAGLKSQITAAGAYIADSSYTEASRNALQDVIDAANAVVIDGSVDQNTVDLAADAILSAIDALELVTNSYLFTLGADGEVKAGEELRVKLKLSSESESVASWWSAWVEYDAEVLEYKGVTTEAAENDATAGVVKLVKLGTNDDIDTTGEGTVVAELTFTVKSGATAASTEISVNPLKLEAGKAAEGSGVNSTAALAGSPAAVTIVYEYGIQLPAEATDIGGVDDLSNNSGTAVKGRDVTFKLPDAGGDNEYTVTYSVDGGAGTEITPNSSGVYTIPGSAVTGAVTVSAVKTAKGTVKLISEEDFRGIPADKQVMVFVPAVKDDSKTYLFDGEAMYWSSKYEEGSFVYIIDAELTGVQAKALITTADSGTNVSISYNGDVNGDGEFKVQDAQLAYALYNGKYDSESTRGLVSDLDRLRADVNGDGTVDTQDARAILVIALS
ncbi:MAG: FIVAR domain-containing protein [Oscillospiraceae bacterium]|jgi:hypothetical protein|nr:FIVAR domain-containing protein [Oscillospiraceae bacterium]